MSRKLSQVLVHQQAAKLSMADEDIALIKCRAGPDTSALAHTDCASGSNLASCGLPWPPMDRDNDSR